MNIMAPITMIAVPLLLTWLPGTVICQIEDEIDQLDVRITHPKNLNTIPEVVDEDLEEIWEANIESVSDEDDEDTEKPMEVNFNGDTENESEHNVEDDSESDRDLRNLQSSADSSTDDGCTDAWTDLSQNTNDRGCVDQAVINKFASKCDIPALRAQMRELKSKCAEGEGKPRQFMGVMTDAGAPQTTVSQANSTQRSRTKRFVKSSKSATWTGGKVPVWDATSQHNIRALKTFERFTCIRFYPWTNEDGVTTNDKLGLDHQGYLKFVDEGGCWADQGNQRKPGGQKVSCCGGITCLHEVGHALGAYHEHQNPLGKGTIRLNPQNAQANKVGNFKEHISGETYSAGFDLTSIMAYGRDTFSNGKGDVITYMFSDLGGGEDWYYLMMEVSNAHKCDELYCSNFTMKCVNDGYLTLVDGVCGCMCPPGLDPSDGCRSTLKDTHSSADALLDLDVWGDHVEGLEDFGVLSGESPSTSIKWPAGQYGLPQTTEGCPGDVFSAGSRVETGAAAGECKNKNKRGCKYWMKLYGCDQNPGFMHKRCPVSCQVCHKFGHHQSATYHLSGTTDKTKVEHTFCVKDNTESDDDNTHLPPGQYCIYRVGGSCPDGFDAGSATFTDQPHSDSANSESGALPDGEFTPTSTKFEFCCTKYGWVQDELVLPRTKAFSLLKSADTKEHKCHRVRGMHVYEGYTAVKPVGKPTLIGNTPVRSLDTGKNTYKIPYCYYTPTQKDTCGGVIDLTLDNPEATISATSGKELMCNWLVKGPESSRIVLKFDAIDIASEGNGDCIDKLTVRYNRLGQPGKVYCGDRLDKTISTVNNTLRISFDTFTEGQSSFTAIVSLISQNNLCYNVTDAGHTYAGTVDRTRALKTCIPWVQAAHCPHNPFIDSDMTAGLVDNYCRNPSIEDGLRPWCYTHANGCKREYCDVCLFESLYDIQSHSNCEVLAKNGLCDNNPNVQELCAKTCSENIKTFPVTIPVWFVSCSPPDPVSDGDIVGALQPSYSVGDIVTYTCKNPSTPSSKERKCLSTGEWSSLNVVCTECDLGWAHRDGHCYRLHTDHVEYNTAVRACADVGAVLVTAKTTEEMDFLAGISFWHGSWLAASDAEVEGQWKWSDGTTFDASLSTRWLPGQPDNYGNEDCVWLTRDGRLEDRWCTRDTFTYICVKAENAVTSCDDITNDCVNFYTNDPTSCTTQADFMHRNCKKTCGLCNHDSCSVDDPSENVEKSADTDVDSLDQGGFVTYQCKSGFRPVSGDVTRGCVAGAMTGQALQCQADNEVATSDEPMERSGAWGSRMMQGFAWTGQISGFFIPKDGKVVKWQFWGTSVGEVVFQVWRSTGAGNKLELVGQNTASTPKDFSATYYVPEDNQISVLKGDFIGIYYPDASQSVGYTKCDSRPGAENLKMLKDKNTSNYFSVGQTYDFIAETKEVCRIYRFKAIVA